MLNIGETITYNASYALSNATSPTYSWGVTLSTAGTINGSSTGSSVSITWNEAGSHSVDLAMNNCTSTNVSSSLNVTVNANCNLVTFANISGSTSVNVFGSQTYSVSHDGDGLFTYYWTYTNLNTIVSLAGNNATADVNFNDCGDYVLSCTVTNCSNVSVSDDLTINCNVSLATLIISNNGTGSVCLGDTVSIDVIGTYTGSTLELIGNEALSGALIVLDTITNWDGNQDFVWVVDRLLNQLRVRSTFCGNQSGESNIVTLVQSGTCI